MVYSLRHTFITRTAAPSIGCEPKHPPDRNPTLLSRSTFNLQTLKLHRKWTKVQKTSNLLASSYLVMGGGVIRGLPRGGKLVVPLINPLRAASEPEDEQGWVIKEAPEKESFRVRTCPLPHQNYAVSSKTVYSHTNY